MKPPKYKERRERPPPKPLDQAALRELALNYAARFATTAAKLERYLRNKLRERGWAGEAAPDLAAITARMRELAYVDDAAWGASRARGLTAKGLGRRRVVQDLTAAGVGGDDLHSAIGEDDETAALAAALEFARRKRLGPFARTVDSSPEARQKAMAAMARGGHGYTVARQVLGAATPDAAAALLDD